MGFFIAIIFLLLFMFGTTAKVTTRLSSCGGCYSGINGINYECCNDMTIDNGVCTCDGDVPCTQCSPSAKDKEKVLLSGNTGFVTGTPKTRPDAQFYTFYQWDDICSQMQTSLQLSNDSWTGTLPDGSPVFFAFYTSLNWGISYAVPQFAGCTSPFWYAPGVIVHGNTPYSLLLNTVNGSSTAYYGIFQSSSVKRAVLLVPQGSSFYWSFC